MPSLITPLEKMTAVEYKPPPEYLTVKDQEQQVADILLRKL